MERALIKLHPIFILCSYCVQLGIARDRCRWNCAVFGTFLERRANEMAVGLCGSGSVLADCKDQCSGIGQSQAIYCCTMLAYVDN